MVSTAPGMMVCGPLIGSRRRLILVAVEVVRSLRRYRNAIEPFRRMRRSARPKHQNEHHRAKEGGPTVHQRRP